ncbi:TetR/AcrR family transcriptional regulator [Pseudomonas chengduensis]|jgi:AcrR family transcriptional regulator|uniref:TetR/AcrR family transcriptional regulator n=1 Tax=Ectopseudomonas oleovorans TaxID=301 RepID=UPI000C67FD69|nr:MULTISPECIES: TetR/AcrR family transcriptional regulator [Pseudomonas]MAE22577.1 TetR family transcriptional regulator [Pseudomonas sp.]MDH0624880.1 TetR/AcrR family transcriptional regulator [Pseudomonas chengduensis]MDH1213212.1 TetR/AcrR family transcriptional regulator [Pseudomonas chengduensis]MDH1281992.1 TetR/AcrR family transcriptional regulator [Pseudomonas chengduensis]MDH1667135.1 TetR/AcrR family transcriptional regulator [Pseudomonas chengduensis]|tara:strand:- start:680 stop:1264 length:585 start_codon:yes stop_codon:yes gene_type:complete
MARPSRKDEILQAALACFTEHGVDVTTIEMIRDRSGASIGSLYHHFGNKERIIAALYLAGTAQYADLLQRGFASAASAEACVKLLVTSYIDWVVANPDWARFILHSRSRVEAGEMGDALREANRQHFAQILTALAEYRRQGLFKALPDDCFASVVIGPTHDLARNWLAGRTQSELGDCRELLAQIAWDSVKNSG